MEKNQSNKVNPKNENISNVKTNEDYNKQKPNANDPNQTKNHQIGEEEAEKLKRKEIISTSTAFKGKKKNIFSKHNEDSADYSSNYNTNPSTEYLPPTLNKIHSKPLKQDFTKGRL